MAASEFLTTALMIFALMAAVGLFELGIPLVRPLPSQRGRAPANVALTVVTLVLNWALTSAAAIVALTLPLQGPTPMSALGVPLAVQIVVGVLVLDFSFGYLAHRLMHATPALWRVHRVHHSDPFVDVTTTYRNHPIEGVWRYLFVIGPVWILGLPPEAVLIHRLASAINGILEHANVTLGSSVDRMLSTLWVTPNMHKIHHSRAQAETDSNYGNLLAIYDRALGTFTPTDRAIEVRYGLDDVDPTSATTMKGMLAMPFQRERVVEAVTPRAPARYRSSPG